jgi:hypothetical protein
VNFALLAFVAAFVSSSAAACVLSDIDYQSLAASPSHLTPELFVALPSNRQDMVCETRAFIAEIDANGGVMTKMEKYSTKYLSPAEKDRMDNASDNLMNALFKSKGL